MDNSSIRPSGGVLLYSLQSLIGKPDLVVTLQALPAGFDATKFTAQSSAPLVVKAGTLYNLSAGDRSKYMLTTTDGALIFINSTGKVNGEVVNSLASNLRKIE